jgi:hypothetical protein
MKHILLRESFLIKESVESDVQIIKSLVAKHTVGADANELVGILLQLLDKKDFKKIDRELAKQNQERLEESTIMEVTNIIGDILNTSANSIIILHWIYSEINNKLNLNIDKEKISIKLRSVLSNIINKSSTIFFKILDKIFDFICEIFGISTKWEKTFEYGVLAIIAIIITIGIVQFPEWPLVLQLISIVSLIIQSNEIKEFLKETTKLFIDLKNGVSVKTITAELKKEFVDVLKIDLPG